MWSVGALLELDDRLKLQEFMAGHSSALKLPKFGDDQTIFEYYVNEEGEWEHWSQKVEEFIYPTDSIPEFSSILVPNVDNVCSAFLIDVISKQCKQVLLIGEQGTAKTVIAKGYLKKYNPEVHLTKSMNFSSATTPNMFQVNDNRVLVFWDNELIVYSLRSRVFDVPVHASNTRPGYITLDFAHNYRDLPSDHLITCLLS